MVCVRTQNTRATNHTNGQSHGRHLLAVPVALRLANFETRAPLHRYTLHPKPYYCVYPAQIPLWYGLRWDNMPLCIV